MGDCAGKAPYEPSYGQGYLLVFYCIIILIITSSMWYYFARMVKVDQFWSKQPHMVCHENIFRYIVCGKLIRDERTNVSHMFTSYYCILIFFQTGSLKFPNLFQQKFFPISCTYFSSFVSI